MGNLMQFEFGLVDKYSAGARSMTAATEALDATLHRATKALAEFEGAGEKAARAGNSFAGWSGPWGVATGALKTMGAFAFDLALGLGEAAFEAGKFVVQTLAFKENTLVSFELMLGSAEKAKDLYKTASDFARVTPFETKDVVTGFSKLISAGFSTSDTKILFQALGDVAATAGEGGTEAFNGMTRALSQMRSLGHVTQQDFNQLLNWSNSMGIGVDQVYGKLGKLLGKTKEQLHVMQSAGTLKSDDFIYAFVDAIKEKSGGKVGGLIERQSSTITGLLSTLRSAPFDFINTMDPAKSKGLQAFKGFLENLVGLFDTGSSAGGRFAALIDKVFNDTFTNLFEDLSGPEGQKRLSAFFENAIGTAGRLYDVVAKFIGLLSRLAPSLETVERVLERIDKMTTAKGGPGAVSFSSEAEKLQNYRPDPTGRFWLPIGEWNQKFGNTDFGRSFGGGGGGTVAGNFVESVSTQSKSLADMVTNPAFANIGDSVAAPARAAGGGGTTVHVTVQVDARGVTDPSGVAEAIREQLPAQLEHLFSRLAVESGRAG